MIEKAQVKEGATYECRVRIREDALQGLTKEQASVVLRMEGKTFPLVAIHRHGLEDRRPGEWFFVDDGSSSQGLFGASSCWGVLSDDLEVLKMLQDPIEVSHYVEGEKWITPASVVMDRWAKVYPNTQKENPCD